MRSLIFAVSIFVLPFGQANAFEINGIRYAMVKDEALSVLRTRHRKVIAVKGNPNTYLASSDQGSGEAVSFCNDQVVYYQYDIVGGSRSFIRLVEKETLINGEATYKAESHETSVGEWGSITFSWSQGKFKKNIVYSSIGEQIPQVYVSYSGQDQCKKT